jgi:hypothetical protein
VVFPNTYDVNGVRFYPNGPGFVVLCTFKGASSNSLSLMKGIFDSPAYSTLRVTETLIQETGVSPQTTSFTFNSLKVKGDIACNCFNQPGAANPF